jgi:serine/threonine protein kinase
MAANNTFQIPPVTQTCGDCGTLIDVSREEPFALMHCPTCGSGLRVRRTFDHFEIQESLGTGGMGAVYRAKDKTLGRMVALKLLRREYSANADFVRQFRTEAASTASINHPHVVQVYSSGEDNGLLYIAMELVDHGSLEGLMSENTRLDELQVIELGIQIAQGLQAALLKNLIHRDIKPGNILLTQRGKAKIVDFGLAALVDTAQDAGGEIWGTPYYVPPETLDRSKEDSRSDIYALGATLYHAIAGRPAFLGETASISELRELKKKLDPIEKAFPQVSSSTAVAINKSIAFAPSERQQNYDEFIQSLEFARKSLLSKRSEPRKLHTKEPRSYRWITFATAALVLILGLALPRFLSPMGAPPKPATAPIPTANSSLAAKLPFETRFAAARSKMFGRAIADAAKAFKELESEPNLPVPAEQWILLHEGLAQLLAGDNRAAEQTFSALKKRGNFSQHPDDSALALFFVNLATLLESHTPILPSQTRSFEYRDHRSFGLLLCGLKNWNLGQYENAAKIFLSFDLHSGTTRPAWISDPASCKSLKLIASQRATEYQTVHETLALLDRSTDVDSHKKWIEQANKLLPKITHAAPLSKSLSDAIGATQAKIKTAEEQDAKKIADLESADAEELNAARKKRLQLLSQFRFSEALEAIRQLFLRTEKAKAEKMVLSIKTELLVRFKAQLIHDLSSAGSPRPIAKKNGSVVPGTPARADEQAVHNKTEYGFLPTPWAEISLESIYSTAQSFLRPGYSPELEPDRKWLLAAFASLLGKPAESRALLTEAAAKKPELASQLELLLKAVDTP